MPKCFRCREERNIMDVMYIPFIDNKFFSLVRYLCGYCIVELAGYWGPKYREISK